MNKIRQILTIFIVILSFFFVSAITYTFAEPKAYDFMTKRFTVEKLPFDKYKKVHGSDDIVLVVIDAKTTEKYRWPWKREAYCKIFEYLHYAKAKVVVYDAVITSSDIENPESDRKFFRTVKKMKNLIVGFVPSFRQWENAEQGKIYDKDYAKKFGIKVVDKSTKTPDFYHSFLPYPKLYFDAVTNIGSVLSYPGPISGNISNWGIDEICRNHEYLLRYKDTFYPSFALRTYLIINNYPEVVLTDKAIKFPEKNYEIKQKKTIYQTIAPIKFYKLYDTDYSHIKYSALDVMNSYEAIMSGRKPILDPSVFKDKVVLVGANVPGSSTGLSDNSSTPLSVRHSGVDIQATAIDNILHNDFLKVLPQWFNTLLTLVGMLAVYGFIRVSNLYKSITSTFWIIFSYLVLSAICFYFSVVINVLTPIVMFIMTTILAYTHKFILESKSKEKVKSAMGKYMSQDVMKRVIQDIDNLGLGGKRANVSVLFSDIRGFTSMSEQMSPQQVSEILNEYFTEMEPIITKYNGVINKFIGDAVMAIFGEPIQDKNHAQNAVKCAYSMLEKVKELQKKWAQEGKPKIEIGVGISTGEVFVGNIGSINRMEYTVIGDTVNLASRLEGYNKTYKTKLLISPNTYEEVKNIVDVIKIPDVQIRGKVNKMNIYEVLKVEI